MKKLFWFVFGLAFLGHNVLFPTCCETECPGPWFTGPLLSPAGDVVPKGYIDIEPYLFYTVTTGIYNSNWKIVDIPNFTNLNFQFLLYLGLTDWADILFVPQTFWKKTQGVSTFTFGDLNVILDFQIFKRTSSGSLPSLKFYIQENFPTGPYQRRDPNRLLTDIGGSGSFETTFGLVANALFEPWYCRFIDLRLNGFITFPTNVRVEGLNAYGGAPDTNANIKPGIEWGGILGLQYSLTQNWAFAAPKNLYKSSHCIVR